MLNQQRSFFLLPLGEGGTKCRMRVLRICTLLFSLILFFTLSSADTIAYQKITITQPTDQQTFVNNETGNIDIKIKIDPKLQEENEIQIILDGKNLSDTQLKNIDRGEHTLLAQIIDKNQKVLIESAPVIFYMQRPITKH